MVATLILLDSAANGVLPANLVAAAPTNIFVKFCQNVVDRHKLFFPCNWGDKNRVGSKSDQIGILMARSHRQLVFFWTVNNLAEIFVELILAEIWRNVNRLFDLFNECSNLKFFYICFLRQI